MQANNALVNDKFRVALCSTHFAPQRERQASRKMTSPLAHAARIVARSLLLAIASASAGAQPPDAVSKLKREGHVACEPSDPYFCANMHVSCAGKTTVPTFPFSLRVTPTGGAFEAPQAGAAFVEQYAGSRVEWSSDGRYVVVHPAGSSGYIKVLRDGKYVFRHYRQAEGLMSRGTCA